MEEQAQPPQALPVGTMAGTCPRTSWRAVGAIRCGTLYAACGATDHTLTTTERGRGKSVADYKQHRPLCLCRRAPA